MTGREGTGLGTHIHGYRRYTPLHHGVKVMTDGRSGPPTPRTTTLAAGTLYDIELHYYEHEVMPLTQWSHRSANQVIPSSRLSSIADAGTGLRGHLQ
jgi:hypothetical protein